MIDKSYVPSKLRAKEQPNTGHKCKYRGHAKIYMGREEGSSGTQVLKAWSSSSILKQMKKDVPKSSSLTRRKRKKTRKEL